MDSQGPLFVPETKKRRVVARLSATKVWAVVVILNLAVMNQIADRRGRRLNRLQGMKEKFCDLSDRLGSLETPVQETVDSVLDLTFGIDIGSSSNAVLQMSICDYLR